LNSFWKQIASQTDFIIFFLTSLSFHGYGISADAVNSRFRRLLKKLQLKSALYGIKACSKHTELKNS